MEKNCFQSIKINEGDRIYQRIYGKSFPKNGQISLEDLRYLQVLHYNFFGEIVIGELIVHESIESDVLNIFKELFQKRVSIESLRLIDDFYPSYPSKNPGQVADENSMKCNNSSAFNYRKIAGTDRISKHALGLAIDINPVQNPYVRMDGTSPYSRDVQYTDKDIREHSKDPHVITPKHLIYKIFTKYGFIWGGDWDTRKDYQHFEKN